MYIVSNVYTKSGDYTISPDTYLTLGKPIYVGEDIEEAKRTAKIAAVKAPDITYIIFNSMSEIKLKVNEITEEKYI